MPNRSYYEQLLSNPNVQAFLNLIGDAEIGHYASGAAQYNIGFGGRLIPDLSWHPYPVGAFRTSKGTTSAAGKYQFERRTWDADARALGLTDFSPHSQDIAALYEIDKKGQLQNVLSGNIDSAISVLRPIWESFKTRSLAQLQGLYKGEKKKTQPPYQQT